MFNLTMTTERLTALTVSQPITTLLNPYIENQSNRYRDEGQIQISIEKFESNKIYYQSITYNISIEIFDLSLISVFGIKRVVINRTQTEKKVTGDAAIVWEYFVYLC